MRIVLFIVLIFQFLLLNANSIDEKIEKLKTTPKEERYKVMNSIKLELIKLNSSQREIYLEKLFQNHKKGQHLRKKSINKTDNSKKIKYIDSEKHLKHQYNKNSKKEYIHHNKHKYKDIHK